MGGSNSKSRLEKRLKLQKQLVVDHFKPQLLSCNFYTQVYFQYVLFLVSNPEQQQLYHLLFKNSIAEEGNKLMYEDAVMRFVLEEKTTKEEEPDITTCIYLPCSMYSRFVAKLCPKDSDEEEEEEATFDVTETTSVYLYDKKNKETSQEHLEAWRYLIATVISGVCPLKNKNPAIQMVKLERYFDTCLAEAYHMDYVFDVTVLEAMLEKIQERYQHNYEDATLSTADLEEEPLKLWEEVADRYLMMQNDNENKEEAEESHNDHHLKDLVLLQCKGDQHSRVAVHRSLLKVRSSYFQQLFSENPDLDTIDIDVDVDIDIEGISVENLESIKHYLYSNVLELNQKEDAMKLIVIAFKFGFDHMFSLCRYELLSPPCAVETIVQLYVISYQINSECLATQCLNNIRYLANTEKRNKVLRQIKRNTELLNQISEDQQLSLLQACEYPCYQALIPDVDEWKWKYNFNEPFLPRGLLYFRVFGSRKCGKSKLLIRWVDKVYKDEYERGRDGYSYKIKSDTFIKCEDNSEDTEQKIADGANPANFVRSWMGSELAASLFCFSLQSKTSLEHAKVLAECWNSIKTPNMCAILVGTKLDDCDPMNDDHVSPEMALEVAQSCKLPLVFVSSKNDWNVNLTFSAVETMICMARRYSMYELIKKDFTSN